MPRPISKLALTNCLENSLIVPFGCFMFSSITKTKIDESEEPFIVRCVAHKDGENYVAHLDVITQQHGLIYPIEALKIAGL